MLKSKKESYWLAKLRRQAESKNAQSMYSTEMLADDAKALSFELGVHHVELEIQNEELRRVMLELEKLQHKYFNFFNVAPVGYFIIDTDGLIEEVNQVGVEMLGATKGFVIKKQFEQFVCIDCQDKFYFCKLTAIERDLREVCELRLRRKDGSEFDAQLIGRNILHAESNTSNLMIAVIDISEYNQAERLLSESDGKLRLTNQNLEATSKKLLNIRKELVKKNHELEKNQRMLEKRVEERTAELKMANEKLWGTEVNLYTIIKQNADGIIIVDHKGIIRFVNDMAVSLLGRKKEELIGETFGFSVVKNETTEIDIIREDGEIITADMRTVEIAWKGEIVYLASLHDITDHKKEEEKLKETMRMKSEFTSMVSHELRTPLTAIKEGIALVVERLVGEINKEQEELLCIAKKNVDRLARMINDVLDFQKLESGNMKFHVELNDINQVVKDVHETMSAMIKNTDVELLLCLDENIPKVGFDSDQITQVLTNLVSNAIKFTEKGNVTITTTTDDDTITVSVSDTGCGIRKNNLARVFDRFEQLATGGDRKTGGTGLGLAISREIIKQHNGTIWAESRFGKGSKFTFTLPKYGIDELFRRHLCNVIDESLKKNSPMSLIIIAIADFDNLERMLPKRKVELILQDMKKLIKNNMRQTNTQRVGDVVLPNFNEFFAILASCSKENVSCIVKRLKRAMKGYLSEQNLVDTLTPVLGYATYPDDAGNDDDLIKKAREFHSMVPSV